MATARSAVGCQYSIVSVRAGGCAAAALPTAVLAVGLGPGKETPPRGRRPRRHSLSSSHIVEHHHRLTSSNPRNVRASHNRIRRPYPPSIFTSPWALSVQIAVRRASVLSSLGLGRLGDVYMYCRPPSDLLDVANLVGTRLLPSSLHITKTCATAVTADSTSSRRTYCVLKAPYSRGIAVGDEYMDRRPASRLWNFDGGAYSRA
ncbi:hypothetical protein BD626DRAFT_628478 [Schizophyllum amplum]|uniref:Uncharacterized protein n=1 Tax=Schizophyllum amplum TaxID=97359 RepID=A0A550CKD8_9AGAR|nr:hypothetical protein BD626DRAFT_628478 [Auriculariopsis ampla]